MPAEPLQVLAAAWEVPAAVRGCTTMRAGGTSGGPYRSLNLAAHVGDHPAAVARNRALLRERLGLPSEPCWLRQIHGTSIVDLDGGGPPADGADGAVTSRPGVVCAVLTADCLPLFLASAAGDRVGIFHVGWRGLATGMIERAVAAMAVDAVLLRAWLGPAIGPKRFEIGPEVAARLVTAPGRDSAVVHGRGDRFLADLHALARRRLEGLGVGAVGAAAGCTFDDSDRWFSHRRSAPTGRMASLVWIAGPGPVA